jgi:putative transposase
MPTNLKRYYGRGDLHFITCSCYRRLPLLGTARARDVFVEALGEVRGDYGFVLAGYVVMPEHVHLLIGESLSGTPSTVMQSLKLRVSKRMRQAASDGAGIEAPHFWYKRFHDFNVHYAAARREKVEYMHRNPVKRGLVEDPKDWVWSSYSAYSRRGTVLIGIDFID